MKVFRVTVEDKCASPDGEDPMSYESYVAVGTEREMSFEDVMSKYLPAPFTDEDIHYYFNEDEWAKRLQDGVIETEEFIYTVGEEYKS